MSNLSDETYPGMDDRKQSAVVQHHMLSPSLPAVGHCHPDVVKAYAEQAGKLYWSPTPNHALLQQYTNHLLSKFPKKLDFVLFVNSG